MCSMQLRWHFSQTYASGMQLGNGRSDMSLSGPSAIADHPRGPPDESYARLLSRIAGIKPFHSRCHAPTTRREFLTKCKRNKDSNHYCCKGWIDHLFIHKKTALSGLIKTSQLCTMTRWHRLNPSLKVMVRLSNRVQYFPD